MCFLKLDGPILMKFIFKHADISMQSCVVFHGDQRYRLEQHNKREVCGFRDAYLVSVHSIINTLLEKERAVECKYFMFHEFQVKF